MTDADAAEFVKNQRDVMGGSHLLVSRLKGRSHTEWFTPGSIAPELLRRSEDEIVTLIAMLQDAHILIEAQRREIEELRREVADAREYKKAFQEATVENARDINEHHEAEIAEALKVIEPFAVFAENVDADGWISNIHRERISTWFGPSDFRAASAFAAKHGGRDG